MRLRKRFKKNPNLGIGVAAVFFCAAIMISVMTVFSDEKQGRNVDSEWFYDLETKTLFAGPINQYPPIDTPSGKKIDGRPAGVRAWVFACDGACDDENNHVILYLEQYSPELHRRLLEGIYVPPDMTLKATMVRKVDDDAWMSAAADDGRAVIEVSKRCPDGSGRRMRRCFPG